MTDDKLTNALQDADEKKMDNLIKAVKDAPLPSMQRRAAKPTKFGSEPPKGRR